MRERRHRDRVRSRSRSRSPLLRRGRAYSPPSPHRHGESSPLGHGRYGAEEPSHVHSLYLSGNSRAERELSPPVRRGREYSLSPPLPPRRFEQHSPPHYRLETKEPVHSQPFSDARFASSSLCLSSDRRRDGFDRESYERRQHYEADRHADGYRDHSLQNKLRLNEQSSYIDSASNKFDWERLLEEKQAAGDTKRSYRTSTSERVYQGGDVSGNDTGLLRPSLMKDNNDVGNRSFRGFHDPSTGTGDRYGFCDGDSTAGYGLGGDGRWIYGKLSTREPSREEERPKFDYGDDLRSAMPSAQIHAPDYPYVSRDRMSRYLEGIGHDERGEMPPDRSAYKELLDTSPVINNTMENAGREYEYTERRRNEGSDFSAMPNKGYYENLDSVREKYGLQGTYKTSPAENFADKIERADNYGGEYSRGSKLLDDQHYAGGAGASYTEGQDDMYGAGTTHSKHSGEEYLDNEPSHMVEDDGFGEGGWSWPYGDSFNSVPLSEDDEGLPDAEWSSGYRLTEEEPGNLGPSEKPVKQTCGFDKRRLGYNFKGELSRSASGSSYEDEGWISKNANGLYGRLQHGRSGRIYDPHLNKRRGIHGKDLFSDDISRTMKRNWRKLEGPAGKDIKKRLGPLPRNLPRTYPWLKTQGSPGKVYDRFSQGSLGGETLETMADGFESNANYNLDVSKTEAPEDSDEFTQLVNSAFLKFVKLLNENAAQRRKYADQGRSGILKCGICGRNSKDFIDTLSLAMHAFATRAAGFRAEHLGLHKALCNLMGWNSDVGPNGTWVRKPLRDAEASALREDLIVWPPIVIIHNSSIANPVPDERLILGVDEVQGILKEMGFGRDKTKVMRGKPANQSIMVANFHGTFSGLWEAESLHKYFIKNARGRIEFDQRCSNRKKDTGTGKAPEDKVSVLYGFLGVAEDLDKLDFETKKRCVVKSRKEIQAIVDVELKCN